MTHATSAPAAARGFLLNGQWLSEGEPLEIHAPHDGSVVGATFRATRAHLDAAIAAAARAFGVTRKMPAYERQRILQAISSAVAARREDLSRLLALDVGGVIINDVPTFRIDHMPYGGVKDSGAGREGIRYAIEEMTERKLLAVNPR